MDSDKEVKERYKVTRDIASAPISAGKLEGSVNVILQQRLRDDGKYSREFISVRLDVGRKTMFFHPDMALSIHEALSEVKCSIEEEQKRIDDELDRAKKAWTDISSNLRKPKETGKTARARAKGKDSTKRKLERSQKDKELRKQMRGR